jgi:hypothetical protein
MQNAELSSALVVLPVGFSEKGFPTDVGGTIGISIQMNANPQEVRHDSAKTQ